MSIGEDRSATGALPNRRRNRRSNLPEVEKHRIENISAARKLLGHKDTETVALMPQSNLGPDGSVRTRDIAAQMMGVSEAYAGWAARVQREDPELFLKIWNGQITIRAAIRRQVGTRFPACPVHRASKRDKVQPGKVVPAYACACNRRSEERRESDDISRTSRPRRRA